MSPVSEEAARRRYDVCRLIAALDELSTEVAKFRLVAERALESPLVEWSTRFLHPRVHEALAVLKKGADK